MPDRYDPKLSVRPSSGRKGADVGGGQPADANDPLAELARIVSGRSGSSSSAPMPRKRTVPAAADATRPAVVVDVLGDLEAELLSDLQASFATVKESLAGSAPPEPSVRAAGRAHASPELPEAAPPIEAERPAGTRPPAKAASPTIRSMGPADAPPPPAAVRSQAAGLLGRPAPAEKPAPPGPAAARGTAPPVRTTVPADRLDIPKMQLRSTVPPPPPPAAQASARQPHSRWQKPAEPQRPTASVASRFAPPRATASQPPPAGLLHADEEEPFGEEAPFAESADGFDDSFDFELDDLVPGYGGDDHLPSYTDDDLETLVKRRSGRGLAAVVAAIAVILIGAATVIMFRSGDTGGSPPPIITADGSPTKVTPLDSGTAEGDQSKLIYDRVEPGATDGEVTLVTPGDGPIADIATVDSQLDNPISRVIIPGGPGIDRPVTDDGSTPSLMADDAVDMAAVDEGGSIAPIGPRRVRTVIVKPDGTIVSSQATQTGVDGAAAPDAVPVVAEPVPVLPAPETDNDTLAIAGTSGVDSGSGELAITPLPDSLGGTDAGAATAVFDEPPPPAPPPAPKPAPTVVATGGTNGPIDITPGRPTPRPAAPAATETAAVAGAGMMVQVSSQRSEDAARATFRDLQARHPTTLGAFQVDIQRADLGDRGTYFRARVGPFSAADAQRLCDDLKSAGGDCILSRN